MLDKVGLFEGLDPEELRLISERSLTRSFPKHTVLISEGDRSDSLYVIESGKVKVYVSDEDGKEMILNILGPGEQFGEIALVDDAPRSASVMTLEPSRMCIISRTDFQAALHENPGLAFNLVRLLAGRVRTLTGSVKSLALMDVYGRVARALLDMAQEDDEGALVIDQRLTHQEIANMVGASREMVSRIFKDLTTGGYITVGKSSITINERLPKRW